MLNSSCARATLIITCAFLYYIIAPCMLIVLGYDMFGHFGYTSQQYFKLPSLVNIGEALIVVLILVLTAVYGSRTNESTIEPPFPILAILLLSTYSFYFIGLYNTIALGIPIKRNDGALLWDLYLNNGYSSIAMSLAILFSVYRIRKHFWFAILTILFLIAEQVSGMRSNTARFLTALLILNYNKKFFITVAFFATALIFNRQFFNGYDLNPIMLFGDGVNTLYGHIILGSVSSPAGCTWTDSLLRIFVFPLYREELFAYSGDLTVCINSLYYNPQGLGNSILNDVAYFPAGVLTFLAIHICLISLSRFDRSLISWYSILIITMLPHIMRLGLITSISYSLSFLLWVLIPLRFISIGIKLFKFKLCEHYFTRRARG